MIKLKVLKLEYNDIVSIQTLRLLSYNRYGFVCAIRLYLVVNFVFIFFFFAAILVMARRSLHLLGLVCFMIFVLKETLWSRILILR
jgi:hypothetical protein